MPRPRADFFAGRAVSLAEWTVRKRERRTPAGHPTLPRRALVRFHPVETRTPEEIRKLVDEGAQLIDVRTGHEWEAGRIPGASHIELSELSGRTEEIDRGRPAVFYCRGDNRSDMAAAAFAAAGYEASVLAGGVQAWIEAGLPLEPEGGYVAESGEAASILEARERGVQS